MDTTKDYVVFNPLNGTTKICSAAEIENGFNWQVEGNQTGIIVIRESKDACFLYSRAFVYYEYYSQANQNLVLGLLGQLGTYYVYAYWNLPMNRSVYIEYSDGTNVSALTYYDSVNKIMKIPFYYPDRMMIKIFYQNP
jgi:hypothetical protein